MGQRGPPPKPETLKRAQGTYREDRDKSQDVVNPPTGMPPMPPDMPDAAVRRWNEVAPRLLALGTLADTDGGALEAYCRAWARWVETEQDAYTSPSVETEYGPKANPACAESRKLHKEVIQPLEIALGLHYAARSRMKAPSSGDKKDEVAEELFGAPRLVKPPPTPMPSDGV